MADYFNPDYPGFAGYPPSAVPLPQFLQNRFRNQQMLNEQRRAKLQETMRALAAKAEAEKNAGPGLAATAQYLQPQVLHGAGQSVYPPMSPQASADPVPNYGSQQAQPGQDFLSALGGIPLPRKPQIDITPIQSYATRRAEAFPSPPQPPARGPLVSNEEEFQVRDPRSWHQRPAGELPGTIADALRSPGKLDVEKMIFEMGGGRPKGLPLDPRDVGGMSGLNRDPLDSARTGVPAAASVFNTVAKPPVISEVATRPLSGPQQAQGQPPTPGGFMPPPELVAQMQQGQNNQQVRPFGPSDASSAGLAEQMSAGSNPLGVDFARAVSPVAKTAEGAKRGNSISDLVNSPYSNLLEFGLALMAAGEPTPGALQGPGFMGALGKAGLATMGGMRHQVTERDKREFDREKFDYEKAAGASKAAFEREKLGVESGLKREELKQGGELKGLALQSLSESRANRAISEQTANEIRMLGLKNAEQKLELDRVEAADKQFNKQVEDVGLNTVEEQVSAIKSIGKSVGGKAGEIWAENKMKALPAPAYEPGMEKTLKPGDYVRYRGELRVFNKDEAGRPFLDPVK